MILAKMQLNQKEAERHTRGKCLLNNTGSGISRSHEIF